jgi:xanthine dehydrogenase accessory factor
LDSSVDREVLQTALEWLEAGAAVVLVTVARTWGSAPRRPGALMAIHPDGRFCGSVSGGCVEDDLAQRVMRGEFEGEMPRLETYGIRAEQAQRVGLPCGGSLKLLVETLASPVPIRNLLAQMEARRRITRRVCLDTGEVSLHPTEAESDLVFDGHNLYKTFGPHWRLLLIGAGELSRWVAQLALSLDFAVTICDPRPEYAADPHWQVPGAFFTSKAPSHALAAFRPDPRSAVLALSHSPALDDDILAGALGSEAFYVGALGSQKSQLARCRRLQRLGISTEQLGRLHGPVGLAIGSRTPAEIAVAIAAALIQERNQLQQTPVHTEQVMHA